jgi:mannose-6-phosphate isomerase-like protein (cupin superfamily)
MKELPMNIHAEIDHKSDLLWFGNSLVAIKVASSSGDDRICVMEQWLPYGDETPLHVHHREDEIFHLMEGQMRFRVGDRELVARAGDTLLAPKGVPHCFRVESPEGSHCLTITKGNDFETMVRTMSRDAERPELPLATQLTPEMIAELTACCARNHIDIMGPPLSVL